MMNTRTLRRARRRVASTSDDIIDGIEEMASALGKVVDKAGGEVGAEIAALPEQLDGIRRAVVTAAEPYRPPKRYRPYVQFGVLLIAVAAVITIVMRRRQGAARSAATPPDQTGHPHSSHDESQHGPISAVPGAKPEHGVRQG